MKRHSSTAGFALTAVVVLGLAGPLAAGEQAPFKGSLEGEAISIVDEFPLRHVLLAGTGEATQLGTYSFVFPHTVHLPTRISAGAYSMVAANGDKVIASGTGLATPTVIDGVFHLAIVEEMTINPTLSTGRFAGATGGFTVERLFNPATGLTIGAFEGTISRPGP